MDNKSKTVPGNVETVLEKLERIDELTEKILKLETRQAELENGLNHRDEDKNGMPTTVETEDGARVKTFRFSGEKITNDSDIDDLVEFDGDTKYEFVFGCTNCNETVPEEATICPKCGSNLGDINSTLNWLEKVGRKHEEEYPEHENDDYYYFDDDEDNEYDPSPQKPKSDFEVLSSSDRYGQARPFCNICGGETDYISKYDNWYCYRCNAYIDEAPVEAGSDNQGTDRTHVLERIINRRHEAKEKKSQTGEKPLKYYAPYAASETVTKISLIEDEQPKQKKRR